MILRCAEKRVRDIQVGGSGKSHVLMGRLAPRLTDLYMERSMFDAQRSDVPAEGGSDNLYEPAGRENLERGGYEGHVMQSSMYTRAALSPARALLVAGVGLAVFAGIRSLANSGND